RTVPPYIVMLTVKGEKADIISGLDAGADDYISKPFDPDELRARINVGRRVLDLETALAARVKEKELLLQEVHHRIKNNMNTMCSILELQSSRIDNPAASAALRDANSRLVSMGVLYDKLYRQENVREMRVAEYVPALLREIIGQFPNRGSVRVELDIGDFSLPPKTLSSIGIIVNELATNAMKYAFPDGREGVIRFSASASDSLAAFSLEDDGIGIPASVDCRGSSGFGLGLVALMAEQIGASIEISREAGTRFEFRLTI
ncbi:MAG: response regulator, partial [Spirochaetes bacterium]|nr:response regulator [Spirochaetota bacterium]